MASIKILYKNILALATVTLSAGTENADFPLYRLWDGGIGRMFKSTAAVTIEIKIDAASALPVDRLIIPSGHNLSGMTLDIKHSDDDVTYTAATAQWTGAPGLIDKSWTSITHRYWMFKITSPASIPELAELFLGLVKDFAYDPDFGWGDDVQSNTEKRKTAGGQSRSLMHGPDQQVREFVLSLVETAEKAELKTFRDYVKLDKPFYLYDMSGVWIFMELTEEIRFPSVLPGLWNTGMNCIEVIP